MSSLQRTGGFHAPIGTVISEHCRWDRVGGLRVNSFNVGGWDAEEAVKGRTAEAIVEELFRALGWSVCRFGWENTLPQALTDLQGPGSDVAQKIRMQPDFVVYKRGPDAALSRGPFYVEAKFRADGRFSKTDIGRDHPYPEAFFVIVTPRKIECITGQELKNGLVISPDADKFWFAKRTEFDAEAAVVLQFIRVAQKMFGAYVSQNWAERRLKARRARPMES